MFGEESKAQSNIGSFSILNYLVYNITLINIMVGPDNPEFVQYTQDSIQRGIPLNVFKAQVDNFRQKFIELGELRGASTIALNLHRTSKEISERIDAIIGKEGETAKDDPAVLTFKDYDPANWQEDDPLLRQKIERFVSLLERSLKK